jgi:hypothetical protein
MSVFYNKTMVPRIGSPDAQNRVILPFSNSVLASIESREYSHGNQLR